jgi:hypothetical protein
MINTLHSFDRKNLIDIAWSIRYTLLTERIWLISHGQYVTLFWQKESDWYRMVNTLHSFDRRIWLISHGQYVTLFWQKESGWYCMVNTLHSFDRKNLIDIAWSIRYTLLTERIWLISHGQYATLFWHQRWLALIFCSWKLCIYVGFFLSRCRCQWFPSDVCIG